MDQWYGKVFWNTLVAEELPSQGAFMWSWHAILDCYCPQIRFSWSFKWPQRWDRKRLKLKIMVWESLFWRFADWQHSGAVYWLLFQELDEHVVERCSSFSSQLQLETVKNKWDTIIAFLLLLSQQIISCTLEICWIYVKIGYGLEINEEYLLLIHVSEYVFACMWYELNMGKGHPRRNGL